MVQDLSEVHVPTGALFKQPVGEEWQKFRLTDDQVRSFHEQGYLAGVQILDDEQVNQLCDELSGLMDKSHPAHRLFYEYHSNESADTSPVLCQGVGAWGTGPAYHDVLWSPAFVMAASPLLGGAVRFWHDELF